MTYFNKNFQQSILILLLATSVISCTKELDKSPLDKFDSQNFWTSESNVTLALTGVYRANITINTTETIPTDWWSYCGLLFTEFATDNAYDRRGDNSAFHKLSNGTLTADVNILPGYWSSSYAKIARANYFLENIDKAGVADAKKNRMVAEVRFLRACQYFYMSQFWGSVPLITHTLTPEEANKVGRASKAEVVKFAYDELTAVITDLPRFKDIPQAEKGRASKQAALAFLGRLLLGEGRYQEAADVYKTIVDFGDNTIDPDYAGLFQESVENSPENIFSVQFIPNLEANGMNQHFFPAVAAGWHIFCPLGSIVESYEFTDGTPFSYADPRFDPKDVGKGRDPRLRYSILYNGRTFQNLPYISHPDSATSADQLGAGKQTTQTGYGLKKLCDESFKGDLKNYGGNLPVIRYAEVLLSYLEAKLEAGQPIDQALLDATINKVRGRTSVNMPKVTVTDPTALRTILRRERRVELAFEGIRYWDLLRWKIADQVLNADFYGAPFPGAKKTRKKGTITDPYSRWYVTARAFRKGVDYTWPIPQSEINVNPNLK